MTDMPFDRYDANPDGCSESGCSLGLPPGFISYCAEELRDKIFPRDKRPKAICDCIITDAAASRITLVELKSSRKHMDERFIETVRGQMLGGLEILYRCLRQSGRPEILLQLVLATNIKSPNNRSDRQRLIKLLEEKLDHATKNLKITMKECDCQLPRGYETVTIQH